MHQPATVPLSRGLFARVDVGDLELLSSHKWYATREGYAAAKADGVQVFMHRVIMDAKAGEFVDHADGDKLNNTRDNLRFCTYQENLRNKRYVHGASKYKGVYQSMNAGRWGVELYNKDDKLHLGYYEDEEQAARVYDAAAKVFYGKFACTNRDLGLLPA